MNIHGYLSQWKGKERPETLFLPYTVYWVQFGPLHLKKDVVKSEHTEKDTENNWGELMWQLYAESKKTLQFTEGYVQSS